MSALNVLTQRYDNDRSGANLQEHILNPRNVAAQPGHFGKLFSVAVQGNIFAQPLYVSQVQIPNAGIRNVVYIATEKNNVYAIDATTGEQLWGKNLGRSVTSFDINAYARGTLHYYAAFNYRDLYPDIGITSTPVVDLEKQKIFVVAKSKEGSASNPVYHYRLHAMDIRTGEERDNPVEIDNGF